MSDDENIIILPPEGTQGSAGAARTPGRWWLPVLIGAIIICIGAGMLLSPFASASWLLSLLVGLAFVTSGLGSLASRSPGSTGIGLFFIVLGVLAMVFSGFTAQVMLIALGIMMVGVGILVFVGGAVAKSTPVMVGSVILVLLGIFAMAWQSVAIAAIAVVLGILSIAIGAGLVSWGIRVRNGRAGFLAFRFGDRM